MKVALLVGTGSEKGREIPIRQNAVVLGKSAECDIRVPSDVVSRRHCRINVEKDSVVLTDLGSKNGTFLNDKKIAEPAVLKSGDKIKLGQVVFEVEIKESHVEAGAAEAAPPAEQPLQIEAAENPEDERPRGVKTPPHRVVPTFEPKDAEEVPVADAVEDKSAPAYQAPPEPHPAPRPAAAPPHKPAEEPSAPPPGDAGFYLRLLECVVAAREEFFEHYRASTRRTRNVLKLLVKILGLSPRAAKMLDVAGLIYDIGKLLLPDTILNKRGPLTPEEKRIMQKHPEAAIVFLKDARLPQELADIIMAHHENYDGTGYPAGQQGEAIPRLARVLAIADALSAMSSSRSYRISLSTAQAIDEIERGAGTRFDPEIARKVADYCRLNMGELRQAVTVTR